MYMYLCNSQTDIIDRTSFYPGRVEVDTVHVVKRIVSLLIDSFQPSNTSPSQQVCTCTCILSGAHEGKERLTHYCMCSQTDQGYSTYWNTSLEGVVTTV